MITKSRLLGEAIVMAGTVFVGNNPMVVGGMSANAFNFAEGTFDPWIESSCVVAVTWFVIAVVDGFVETKVIVLVFIRGNQRSAVKKIGFGLFIGII